MKSSVDLAILVIIAVSLFVLLLVYQELPLIKTMIEIRRSVNIVINLNDEGSKVNAFLNTRTPAVSVPESIALHASGYEKDNRELDYVVKQTRILGLGIFVPPSADGSPKEKFYGTTMAIAGHTLEIPLPGGGRGRMEVFFNEP